MSGAHLCYTVLCVHALLENGEGKKKQVNGDDLPDWVMVRIKVPSFSLVSGSDITIYFPFRTISK